MASVLRFGRVALGGALIVATAGAALAVMLALGGEVSHVLDLFAQVAPLCAATCLAGVVVAAVLPVSWRRTIIGLGLAGVLASAVLMAPEFTRSAGPVAAPGQAATLKVIQFNALMRNGDVDRVIAWLLAQDADVLAITEARSDLKKRLRAAGWSTAGAHGHLIIFTRERYLRMERPKIASSSRVTFVNATYAHPDGDFEVMAAHLQWPSHPEIRAQVATLKGLIAARQTPRLVMLGDFNATPWSAELRSLDKGLSLTRRDRAIPTFPAQILGRPWPLPFLPIDHVYAGPGWATVSVERGPWLGSDHYPLIVTLAPVAPR